MLIPFLTLISGIVFKRRLVQQGKLDITEIKYRKAQKVAIQRLEQASIYQEQGDARNFYDEISKATLGYVSDKYKIPPSELTKSNIQATILDKGYDESVQKRFLTILDIAEKALFAGMTSEENLKEVYQEAVSLISEMEQKP